MHNAISTPPDTRGEPLEPTTEPANADKPQGPQRGDCSPVPADVPTSTSTPSPARRKGSKRGYSQHGLVTLRKSLKRAKRIDRRTRVGKALAQWRNEVVRDLGGAAALSAAQLALIDQAARTKLLLDSVDTWLLQQPTIVNKRSKSVMPVVRDRLALCDSLLRHLDKLGLDRRATDVPDLATYLRNRAKATTGGTN
jgi:hypothetical protein